MAVGGQIPPKQVTHMDVECKITENKVLHPFAYRTHTHSLGERLFMSLFYFIFTG